MAEKHKSKYKAPKDLEKSQKPKPRKDLKDYTEDDKNGKMNPKSTGDKQLNVLRKTDKAVQDDGKLYPTYNADERLYKDLEDAEYDPKTAAKRMEKREKEEEKTIKDKIDNLTVEQREHLIREYIRRKIQQVLREQTETPEEETPTELPAEEAPIEPAPTDTSGTAPTADATMTSTPAPTLTPAPDASAETPETPAAEPAVELDPAAEEAMAIQKFVNHLREKEVGNIARIKTLSKVMNALMKEAEPEDKTNFYTMLRQLAISKLQKNEN